MKPRLHALTVPETDRYWSVELEDKGEYHFQFPGFPRAGQAVECAMAYHEVLGQNSSPTQVAHVVSGLFVGYCWYHRGMALEAERPNLGASHESLIAYSEAVSAELQDYGFAAPEILRMYYAAVPVLLGWWRDLHGIGGRGADPDAPTEAPEPAEWTTEDGADPGPFTDSPDSPTEQSSAAV